MNKFPCRKGAPPGSPVKPTQLGKQPVKAKLLKESKVWESTKVNSKNNPLAFMTPFSLKFGGGNSPIVFTFFPYLSFLYY